MVTVLTSEPHRLQPGNPFFHRRMRREELQQQGSGKGVNDEEMRSGGGRLPHRQHR